MSAVETVTFIGANPTVDGMAMRNVPWPPPMAMLRKLGKPATPGEAVAMVAVWCADMFGESIGLDEETGRCYLRQHDPERFWYLHSVVTPYGKCDVDDLASFVARQPEGPTYRVRSSGPNRAQRRAAAKR